MTMLFTSISAQADMIAMTVDSAVSLESSTSDFHEFRVGSKSCYFEDVGCVATWGARNHNEFKKFLDQQSISKHRHSVNDLADMILKYLTDVYKPHELNIGDVGYHVSGFTKQGEPKVFHIFWGKNRPSRKSEKPDYHYQDNLSQPTLLLFNGRNELAQNIIDTHIRELYMQRVTNYNLSNQISLIEFADFVARFAAEVTPEVGPPFLTYIISPINKIKYIKNRFFSPINRDLIAETLIELGYAVTGDLNTMHEIIVRQLPDILYQYLQKLNLDRNSIQISSINTGKLKLIMGDNPQDVLEPDVLIVLHGSNCKRESNNVWHGVPSIIIEILAPETEIRDRGYRFKLYEKYQVPEYWMINPMKKSEGCFIEVWNFSKDEPNHVGAFGIGDDGFYSQALGYHVDQETMEHILGFQTYE